MVNSPRGPPTFNATYVRDYEYSTQVNRWFLKPIGAWPQFTQTTKTEKFLAKLLNLACHSLILFTVAPSVLFILFEDTSTEERLKAVGPMSHWLMGELNYCCLLLKNNDILHCLEHVERDWRMVKKANDRELMLKSAKFGRFIACITAFCMHIGVSSNSIMVGIGKLVFRVGNESYVMHRLPCAFYTKLVDVRFSPANEIMLILQFLSGCIVNSVTVGACGLAAVLAMHACGQLKVVMSGIDDLVDTKVYEERVAQRKLSYIVKHHLRSLSFVWSIEKVMHIICLIELVGCTFNMCMLEYYCLTEKSKQTAATYAIIYAAMIFNIFIFCYIGDTLSNQCKEVGKKVYMTEWYRLPRKTVLDLLMIISRSSVVIQITAGKLVQMSIATLADVFKASFAYFNMIRTIAM